MNQKILCVFSFDAHLKKFILKPLTYVELGRVPSALPPVFTASHGLSESRNVRS